jgi:hypothetical protein
MDIEGMLKELRQERAQIEEAILALERMAHSSGKRRGRPPKWLSASRPSTAGGAEPAPKRKRQISPEGRARIVAATKKRWAERKASAAAAGTS